MSAKRLTRRQERVFALQVLYSLNFEKENRDHFKKTFSHFQEFKQDDLVEEDTFAWQLAAGVVERQEEIDKVIVKHSRNWKLSRIALVDLAILRLSLYEILFCSDIPLNVAINEGVELAKSFGDDNSRTFVNGILDAAGKSAR